MATDFSEDMILVESNDEEFKIGFDPRLNGGGDAKEGALGRHQHQQPVVEARTDSRKDAAVVENASLLQPGPVPSLMGNYPGTQNVQAGNDFVQPYRGIQFVQKCRQVASVSPEFCDYVWSQARKKEQEMLLRRKGSYTKLGHELSGALIPPDTVLFKLLSYNILAQEYIEDFPHLYKNCPSPSLDWDMRSRLLLEEIDFHRPDIVCLQEVQDNHFKEHLDHDFARLGYTSVFKKKTGRKPDGCVVLWRSDLFYLANYTAVEYQMKGVPLLKSRDQIGIIVELVPNGKGEEDSFFVATTHLLYNRKRDDVRLAQIQVFLAELDRVAFCGVDPALGNMPRYKPVILCGDFNSVPSSPVYKLLIEGKFQFADFSGPSLKDAAFSDGLIPAKIAITDRCQHAHVAGERLRRAGTSDDVLKAYTYDEESYIVRQNIIPAPSSRVRRSGRNLDLVPAEVSGDFWRRDLKSLPASRQLSPKDVLPPGEDVSVQCASTNGYGSSVDDSKKSAKGDLLRQPYGTGTLSHSFDFCSVYPHEPEDTLKDSVAGVTTFQEDWVTVDYIFYTTPYYQRSRKREENRLQLLDYYSCMTPEQCAEIELDGKSMPTYGVASDHFPIIATFLLHLKPTSNSHGESS